MPRKATVTTEHLSYLRTAVRDEVPFTVMARNVGVCVDTCKRILHKHGIMEFEAAKYVAAAPLNPPPAMWSRPCMACGSTELRPKWQYRCDRCHEREAAGATDWYRPSAPRPSPPPPIPAPPSLARRVVFAPTSIIARIFNR